MSKPGIGRIRENPVSTARNFLVMRRCTIDLFFNERNEATGEPPDELDLGQFE